MCSAESSAERRKCASSGNCQDHSLSIIIMSLSVFVLVSRQVEMEIVKHTILWCCMSLLLTSVLYVCDGGFLGEGGLDLFIISFILMLLVD